jgi:hypothetical protein
MNHSEFQIGETFWCGGHEWCCTDLGKRTVIAIRIDSVEAVGTDSELFRTLSREEAEAQGSFNGPPYGVAESVFDEYDIPACSFVREGHGTIPEGDAPAKRRNARRTQGG